MTRSRLFYKKLIKEKECKAKSDFTDNLGELLCKKNIKDFWHTWNKKFSSNISCSVIEGLNNNNDIAQNLLTILKTSLNLTLLRKIKISGSIF